MAAPAAQTQNKVKQEGAQPAALPEAARKDGLRSDHREPALLQNTDAKPIDPAAQTDRDAERCELVKLLNIADLARGKNNHRLFDDPSLAYLSEVHGHLCAMLADNPERRDITNAKQRVETAAHLARNLYFTGQEVSRKNVEGAFAEYGQLKALCADVPLFSGRSIVYIAGYQKVKDDPKEADRFGREAAIAKLRDLAGSEGSVTLVKPRDASPAALAEAKEQALKTIANTPPGVNGFLVIFDCHGTPGYFVLSGDPGTLRADNVADYLRRTAISTDELGDALLRRQASSFPETPGSQDMLLALTCYSHDNLRQLGRKLSGSPKSLLALAITECGQPGYSNFSVAEGNLYLHAMLDLPEDRATVGGWIGALNFIDRMTGAGGRQLFGPRLPSNPSIFLLQPDLSTPRKEQKEQQPMRRLRQLSGAVDARDVLPAGYEEDVPPLTVQPGRKAP